MKELKNISYLLVEMKEDSSIPKNIREIIEETIVILNDETESSIKVNKVLDLLETVADDSNLESYTRTQILNVVTLLEKL